MPAQPRWRKLLDRLSLTHCWACGRRAGLRRQHIITPDIAAGCGFSADLAEAYDRREGLDCRACGSSRRSWHLARTLIEFYGGPGCRSLAQLCAEPLFSTLAIAEVNECGHLHQFLKGLPRLSYSEFGSTTPGVAAENLLGLSYSDASFDLFLTSDTLEHVPDVERALREIHRVLKPDGRHIFTIPVVWNRRETLRRAIVEDGKIVHLMLPPCYHGGSVNPEDCLAFYEYGADVVELVRDCGFTVEVRGVGDNPAVRTLVTQRVG